MCWLVSLLMLGGAVYWGFSTGFLRVSPRANTPKRLAEAEKLCESLGLALELSVEGGPEEARGFSMLQGGRTRATLVLRGTMGDADLLFFDLEFTDSRGAGRLQSAVVVELPAPAAPFRLEFVPPLPGIVPPAGSKLLANGRAALTGSHAAAGLLEATLAQQPALEIECDGTRLLYSRTQWVCEIAEIGSFVERARELAKQLVRT